MFPNNTVITAESKDFITLKPKPRLTSVTGEAGDSSSPSWFLLLILLALSGSSFIIASLVESKSSIIIIFLRQLA